MNIIMKLALRHLESNIKRTVITIFGIAASTALITAMLTGVYSVFCFVADVSLYVDGVQHAYFKDLTETEVDALKSESLLEYVGVNNRDYDVSGFYIDSDAADRFKIGNIYHCDAENLLQLVTCEYEGRLPENASEIAIEDEFIKDNNLDIKPGDTLSFHQGNRYGYEEGKKVYYGGAYRSYEEFETLSDETCTVTAILHNNEPTSSYDIIRGMDSFPESNYVFITLKKADVNSVRTIKEIAERVGIKIEGISTEYLMSIFAKDLPYDSVNAVYRMICLALVIIIIASAVMIYNAFAMSLTERMKYLGMLSSVGATKKQKRASVYYEGIILGLIGVPVGYLFGIIGCYITLGITGKMIIDTKVIRGVTSNMSNIPVRVHPLIILGVIFFAAITIFLSSFVPAIKASRITAIDAIRETTSIKYRAWKLKVLPFVKMIFGYEGELAAKNIKRNGAKGVIITLSLAISLVMFLSVIYFFDLYNKENSYEIEIPFQVMASASFGEREKLKEAIEKLDGVEKIYVAEMYAYDYKLYDSEGKEREIPNTDILNPAFLTNDYKELFDKEKSIWVVPVEDEDFIEICKSNNIDYNKYFGDELKGVLLDNYNHERTSKSVFNQEILGQKLYYDKAEDNPPAVTIEDFVKWDNRVDEYKLSPKGSISVYVPASIIQREYVKHIDEDKLFCTYGIKCENHEEIKSKVSDILEFDGFTNTSCSDIEESLAVMKTLLSILKTIMYGFTILISLIIIANIVNTITTGVQARRKEFALFKSVGMTEFGFKKMLFLETFLYAIRALLIGLPLSALLQFLIYKSLGSSTTAFEINGFTYMMAAAGVFAIVGIGMLLTRGQLKHDSIIDVLKEDIC